MQRLSAQLELRCLAWQRTACVVALVAWSWAGISPAAAEAPRHEQATAVLGMEDARHLLARTGFGPTLAEVQAHAGLTREAAIRRVLSGGEEMPEAAVTPPPDWVESPILPFRAFREASAEERLVHVRTMNAQTRELRGWWIREMFDSPWPLRERMTLFWHNHFATSQQKVRYPQLVHRQNELFRAHALGRFDTLLRAVARDPAMIIYLDSATNRRGRPNENFAREVMELFTLGEGHYSEADIREAARAFTGWSVDPNTGEFINRITVHDAGTKTVLGRSGNFDGDGVLDILLAQPRSAEFIVEKLWREFVSPEPEREAVVRIAAAFRDSGHDIRTALRGLLQSEAFWRADNRASLVKSPAEFVVGALRQLELPGANPQTLAQVMAGLGQNLFAPPNVKGWPGGEAWINGSTLLARKQFVERLFRTEEMLPAMMITPAATAEGGQAQMQRPAAAPRAQPLPAFNSRQWFKSFGDDRDPAIETFVLATPPALPVPAELRGREWLRQLALDPAFQLK